MSRREFMIVLAHSHNCGMCRAKLLANASDILASRSLSESERETLGGLQFEDFITPDGLARAARVVLVNGVPGAVWAPGGKPKVVLEITITNGKISGIDAIADPGHLEELDLMYLDS